MPTHQPTSRRDSPVIPAFTTTLSDHHRKLSAISESFTKPLPLFPTFLDSPSPPTSHGFESPILPFKQTFLDSPSPTSRDDYESMLAAFPLPPKHNSTATPTFSDFSGEYPSPPLSYGNSTSARPSWTTGHSSTSPAPISHSRPQRLSDILPDNMSLYAEYIDSYDVEPVQPIKVVKVSRKAPAHTQYKPQRMSDIIPDNMSLYAEEDTEPVCRVQAATGPSGLGLELPVIGDKDFAYYPKTGNVDQGVQTEIFGLSKKTSGSKGRKKGGVRFAVGNLVRKVCMKMGVRRYV